MQTKKTIIPYHHKTPTCSWNSSTLEPLSARFLETDRGASASRVTALLVPGRTLQFHEASRRPDLKPAAIQNTRKETHARNIYSWVPTKPVEVQQPTSIFGCPRMGMHLPGATRLWQLPRESIDITDARRLSSPSSYNHHINTFLGLDLTLSLRQDGYSTHYLYDVRLIPFSCLPALDFLFLLPPPIFCALLQ
jgi:hypothetical protein